MATYYQNGQPVQKVSNAYLRDDNLKRQAGIDPKTNKPDRMKCSGKHKSEYRRLLRIRDEQDAINCFEWTGLPEGLTGKELEKLLYYHGNLCFFYLKPLDQFFFMPYALDGTIDFYGRFNEIHPVPIANGTTETEKAAIKTQAEYLSTIKLKVLHDVPTEVNEAMLDTCAVILRDYTNQRDQGNEPRQVLNDCLIDTESDILCYLRTSLKNSTGVVGMKVSDQTASSNVLAANDSMDEAALEGIRMIPVISPVDLQEFANGDVAKSEEYLEALQSVDNLRKEMHGIENGGMYQKKAHMLQSEQTMNASGTSSVMDDRLQNRLTFAEIVNAYTGLNIGCRVKQQAQNQQVDYDYDTEDEEDVQQQLLR